MSASEQLESVRAIGAELRAAREAGKLSVEDVARAIRLTTTIVHDLEAQRFSAVGAAVYARGFLRSYGKFMGLSAERVESAIIEQGLGDAPSLLASQGERQRPALGERWMLAASYLVGTAILVSAIFFVMQADRLPLPRSVRTPDVVTAPAMPTAMPQLTDRPLVLPVPAVPTLNPGIPVSVELDQAPIAAAMTALPDLGPKGYAFQLSTGDRAWVEITDADGQRLEFDNVAAGSNKQYQGKPPFNLLIGNAMGAKLSVAGQDVDLVPHIRGSVAKLRLVQQNGQLTAETPTPQ